MQITFLAARTNARLVVPSVMWGTVKPHFKSTPSTPKKRVSILNWERNSSVSGPMKAWEL